MTKIYIDETIDTDLRVFFNTLIVPSIIFVSFNNIYFTFLSMVVMFMVYEFVIMDNYFELYSDEELEIKRNTLNLCYLIYVLFLFVFGNDILAYLKP